MACPSLLGQGTQIWVCVDRATRGFRLSDLVDDQAVYGKDYSKEKFVCSKKKDLKFVNCKFTEIEHAGSISLENCQVSKVKAAGNVILKKCNNVEVETPFMDVLAIECSHIKIDADGAFLSDTDTAEVTANNWLFKAGEKASLKFFKIKINGERN